MLFKKIAKGLNNKNFVIAKQERKIQALKAKIVQLEPRKRRKVKTSPNSKFANIEKIYKAQIEAEDRQNVPLDSDDFFSIASTLSHIFWLSMAPPPIFDLSSFHVTNFAPYAS